MSSSCEQKCCQCLQSFTTSRLPYRMEVCAHSICGECVREVRQAQLSTLECSFCGATISDILDRQLEPSSHLESAFEHPQDGSTREPKESQDSLLEIDEEPTQKLKQRKESLREVNEFITELHKEYTQQRFCKQHEKPFEIICVSDLEMICPHCAIFGDHKDHVFKTLKELSRDCDSTCERMQMLKHQKYMHDKKINTLRSTEYLRTLVESKSSEVKKIVQLKFERLIYQIRSLEEKASSQIDKFYGLVEKQISNFLDQESKLEKQFNKWESQCQDQLSLIERTHDINQKIKVIYGPTLKLEHGSQLLEKINRKYQAQAKRIQILLNSVGVEFGQPVDLSKLVKISKKQEESKKDAFVQMLQKLSLPKGNHILEELETLDDTSFVFEGSSKQDLSLIIDGETKRPCAKSVTYKKKSNLLKSAVKLNSPNKPSLFQSKNLQRVKSNGQLKVTEMANSKSYCFINQTRQKTLEIRDPESIASQFIKQDLKETLDLSRCDLNDQKLLQILRSVRRSRKIRGLKLCHNLITDAGLQCMLDMLGTTTNINVAYNKLTEESLSALIKNRDKISPLRIVNMTYNGLNDKKCKNKLDSLKKMGIIVNI